MKSVADRGSLHVLAAFMLSLQRCNWCQMLCSRTRCRRSVRLTGPGSPKSLNMSFRDLPVDRRYQGAENDIVIVSLVRSNQQNRLGFLGTDDGKNRMCVAQSRARCGMYFIGNEACLRTSVHWCEFLDMLQERGCVGSKFPQRCPRHRHVQNDALEAEDVCTTQSAVCGVLCGAQFACGIGAHTCKRPCHPEEDGDSHSASKCDHVSTLVFNCSESPSHEFQLPCRERTKHKFCPYKEQLSCRRFSSHKLTRKCGQLKEEVLRCCQKRCESKLGCGHFCPKKCFEPCIQEAECLEKKPFDCPSFPEKHSKIHLACNSTPEQVAENCRERCSRKLPCEHHCPNKCGEPCATTCHKPCRKMLGCGHLCPRKCFEPCIQDSECLEQKDFDCPSFPEKHCKIHLACNSTPEQVALNCRDRCSRKLSCDHYCPNRCGDPCATKCHKACRKKLGCGHLCPRKCFEPCIQDSECLEKKDFDCPSFPEKHSKIHLACNSTPEQVAENCRERCSRKLPCEHYCPNKCGEPCATTCHKPCRKKLGCGHFCTRTCFEPCTQEAECLEKKDFDCPSFPEEHSKIQLACNSTPEQVAASCREPCSRKLPCGHYCPNTCGEACATVCQQRCSARLACGHACSRRCGEDCR